MHGDDRLRDFLLTGHLCAHSVVFFVVQEIGEDLVGWTSASGEIWLHCPLFSVLRVFVHMMFCFVKNVIIK